MKKIQIVFSLFILLFLAIGAKLFYIQAFQNDTYASNVYLKTNRIEPTRGEIFDRSGEPLVLNKTEYRLFINPQLLPDKDYVTHKLDSVLKMGEATVSAKVTSDKRWVAVKGGLSDGEKKKVEKLGLKGIGFEDESARFYPEASIASHLVGFLGKNADGGSVGYFGLEGYYDQDLAGLPGIVKTERDLSGKPIIVGVQEMVQGENGRDLYLTLDKNVQRITKTILEAGVEKYAAKSGCIFVYKPKRGEFLAMTCTPDFDPGDYSAFSSDFYANPAVSSVYEPGSIFKPLVMAAALNEGVVKPSDTYTETGPVTISGYEINNWDKSFNGELTLTEILEKSSNLGMVYVGSKLKKEVFRDYLHKYGFGYKTGIDLQGELPSRIKQKWYPIDYATAAFGQGIAVTPIQMVTAFGSILNDGWLMKPHVVGRIRSDSGEERTIEPRKVRQVVTAKTSKTIRKMLEQVVSHAEVKWKIPQGYTIGGKTGTAQIAFEGSYAANRTVASFVGFTPVESPEYLIMVMLNEPSVSQWGSETAAPLFFSVLNELILYYNIAPKY